MMQTTFARLPQQADENSLVAALCLTFTLPGSGARMLVQMLTQTYSTKEELMAAASHEGRGIAVGSMNALLSVLRRQLAPFDIQISTIPKLGYALDKAARDKIHRSLADYGADVVAAATPVSQEGKKVKFEAV